MDLVAGVRKEGSRGGRDAFKWEDVKDDQHRENYLGHSLMAPVGRWQKNKDLSWYAKGDTSQAATDAANARAEEIRMIKEAEQDALSEALGFKVEPRLRDSQLAGPKEVEKAIKEAADEEEGGKGIGYGGFAGGLIAGDDTGETMIGYVGERGGIEGTNPKREKRERKKQVEVEVEVEIAIGEIEKENDDTGGTPTTTPTIDLTTADDDPDTTKPAPAPPPAPEVAIDPSHPIIHITIHNIIHNNNNNEETEENEAAPPTTNAETEENEPAPPHTNDIESEISMREGNDD